ncbi:MAG: hypothetical protein RDV48_12110 [Candidatus Eremiobacteraeota bacterium]|nr:hypothetical protein [Candidatus Eremiobacteraeota bacterium]
MKKLLKKKGLALASIMLVMLVLSLLAVSVVGLTTNQYRYSLKKQNDTLAMQAALTGLDAAEKALDRELTSPSEVKNWDLLAPGSSLVPRTRVGEKSLYYKIDIMESSPDTCSVITTSTLENSGGSIDKQKRLKATFKKNCFLYAAYGCAKDDVGVALKDDSIIRGDVGSSRTSGKAVAIGQDTSPVTADVTSVSVSTTTHVQLQQNSPTSNTHVNVNQTTTTFVNSSDGDLLASNLQQNSTSMSTPYKPPSASSMLSMSVSQSMTVEEFVPPIKISQNTSISVTSPLSVFANAITTYSLSVLNKPNKKELSLKTDEPAAALTRQILAPQDYFGNSAEEIKGDMASRGGHGSSSSSGWSGPPIQYPPQPASTPSPASTPTPSPSFTPTSSDMLYTTSQHWSISNDQSSSEDQSKIVGDIYLTPAGQVERLIGGSINSLEGSENKTYLDKLTGKTIPVPAYLEPAGSSTTSAIPDTLTGGTYIYDTFEATGRTITIDASKGPIILYVRQSFIMDNSKINFTTSGTACDPRNLIVYASPSCSVSIKNGSRCSLLMAAPSTDIDVQGGVKGSSLVVGSLLGNKVNCSASVIEYPKGRLKDMRDRALLVSWEELP